MGLVLVNVATPSTPASTKGEVFLDSADGTLKMIDANGLVHSFGAPTVPKNFLINGGFDIAQRQVPTTLTSYAATADRTYAFDRWGLSIQTSSLQAQQVDTLGTPVTNVTAPSYLKLKQITGAGKFMLTQVVHSQAGAALRGRKVRVQFKAKYGVSAMTLRCAVIEVTSAGTVDTPTNPFTTAWGANSTDPTLGASLNKVAPLIIDGGTNVNGAAQFVLTSTFARYSATFTLTSTAKNFIVAIWSDSQLAVNDELWIAEAGLYDREAPVLNWAIETQASVLCDCQAFYWKSFPPLTAPAQSAGVGGALRTGVAIAGAVTTSSVGCFKFPVQMVKVPTMTFYNPSAGNAFARNVPAATDATATAAASTDTNGFDWNCTGLAGWTVGQEVKVHAQAVAEI